MPTDREFVANLIKKVLMKEISVATACKNFPKNTNDRSISAAFFALAHIEADENLRAKSSQYSDEQDDYLLTISQYLEQNQDLPINILQEYAKFYEKPPIYKKINWKFIIEELKRKINL